MADENEKTEETNAETLAQTVAKLLAKHQGEPSKAVEQLVGDNYRLRLARRQDKQNHQKALDELKTKAIPEGRRLLTDDEGNLLKKIEELGGLEKLSERLGRLDELEGKEAERSWAAAADEIAAHPSVRFNAGVFRDLLKAKGLDPRESFVVVGEGPQGRVEIKDGKDKVALSRYAEKHWADHLPSLRAVERGKGRPDNLLQRQGGADRQLAPPQRLPSI